jgi:hypothetical protein
MPINKYFSGYNDTAQQELYRRLINEAVQMYGVETLYIPRTSESELDLLFGDDPTKAFANAYPMVMYVQNVDGFDGPGDLFSKFGLVINKQVHLLLANDEFQTANTTVGIRPREGDLIWMRNFQALYEIIYTNQDKFFYSFGRRPFYGFDLTCEEFRYNNEKIETGYQEVDEKVNENKIAYQAIMGAGNGTYQISETVYQGPDILSATVTATVLSWDRPTGQLIMKDIVGEFTPNHAIIGVTSDASFIMNSIETEDNVNESLDNNVELRTDANTYLDLTESNPAGNPITSQSQE